MIKSDSQEKITEEIKIEENLKKDKKDVEKKVQEKSENPDDEEILTEKEIKEIISLNE